MGRGAGWRRRALVLLPDGWQGARDASGEPVPTQTTDGRALAEVDVPSCGWTTLARADEAALAEAGAQRVGDVVKSLRLPN